MTGAHTIIGYHIFSHFVNAERIARTDLKMAYQLYTQTEIPAPLRLFGSVITVLAAELECYRRTGEYIRRDDRFYNRNADLIL